MAAVVPTCDVGVIRSTRASAPCRPSSRPWVIAAASMGSGMAFLDATVLNVALPAVQEDLEVSASAAQWVYGAYALVLAALLLVGGSLADRYGRRRVFVAGAALFALASAWCALAPSHGQLVLARLPGVEQVSYWTSFFPAMVVQDLGMALIITPLTAAALGSVDGEHSALASGVNNAVARMAGLLAVAVLGVFIYGAFSANLDAHFSSMSLPDGVRSELEAAKSHLGAAEAPEGVDAGTAARIERAVDKSFVAGFRTVMLVCSALALASALAAVLLVEDERRPGIPFESVQEGRSRSVGKQVPLADFLRLAAIEECHLGSLDAQVAVPEVL